MDVKASIETEATVAAVPSNGEIFAGRACVDTSRSRRLPVLMEMVGALSRAGEPAEVLHAFAVEFRKLYGPQAYVSLSTRGLGPGEYKITRLLQDDESDRIGDADPWAKWTSLPVHRGGFLGDIIRQAYPQIIHNLHLRDDPVLGDSLQDYGSLMAIPLFDGGEPLNWSISLRRDPASFTVEELEEDVIRSNLGGAMVKNVMITRQLREANETIRREVEQIATIQRALLPKETPDIPGLSIAASYHTYDQAGGDYYDFLPLRPTMPGQPDGVGPWGLLIADAAGHGPAAAVLMAMLHAILHAYPRQPENPGEVLDHANEHLCRKGIKSSYITGFFAIYDPPTRRLTYARAGHPPPLLKDPGPGGAVRRLDAVGSIPLGILPDVRHEHSTITLQPGQTVVLYTDGITEAMSPNGAMFGVDGVEAALERCSGMPGCVHDSISDALRAHEADVRPSDDQTLVALRVDDE
ncbi:MAG: PP2C family protein-serine/threonine phosphatase [Planctomycetota bacterium]|nr:PP2C family protein-serine/threonine phosphatase [Planctomycetota bacterium]